MAGTVRGSCQQDTGAPWPPPQAGARASTWWTSLPSPGSRRTTRFHHAPDLMSLLAHRPVPASQGRLHGPPEQPPGRRPQAGGQETPAVPSSGRSKSSASPAGSAAAAPAERLRPLRLGRAGPSTHYIGSSGLEARNRAGGCDGKCGVLSVPVITNPARTRAPARPLPRNRIEGRLGTGTPNAPDPRCLWPRRWQTRNACYREP